MVAVMVEETSNEGVIKHSSRALIRKARQLLASTRDIEAEHVGGVEFGRNLKQSIEQMDNGKHAFILNMHRKEKAAVLGIEQFKAYEELAAVTKELIDLNKKLQMQIDGNQFDEYFARIQSPESRNAADTLFEDELDLASTFKPGATETQ